MDCAGESEMDCCSICLEGLIPKDGIYIVLKCSHKFHLDCVKNVKNNVCPNCRSGYSGNSIIEADSIVSQKTSTDHEDIVRGLTSRIDTLESNERLLNSRIGRHEDTIRTIRSLLNRKDREIAELERGLKREKLMHASLMLGNGGSNASGSSSSSGGINIIGESGTMLPPARTFTSTKRIRGYW